MLSKLLQKAEERNKLKDVKLAKGCQPISHLQFADDLFIFGRANEENIRSIKECLSTYSSWLGQKINTHKSTMVFSKNLTSWHSKHLLAGSMGLKIEGSKGKYLGLPMLIGKSKKGTFQEVVERVEKKYQGWKVKILSQAARTSLIRTVTSAMPSYVMSSLKLPKETTKKLDALNRKFWWGSKENGSSCCILKKWDSICKPKSMGGDRKSTRLNSSHAIPSRMPSSA